MKQKKNIVIGVLCMALVFMGIGYSLLQSTLNISGTATASGNFDVKITNIEIDSQNTSSGATNTVTLPVPQNYAVTETTLSATFNAPGDHITYDITVTNRGSIDATITVNANPQVDYDDYFEMSCNAQEGTQIAAGASTSFKCTISLDRNLQTITNIPTANLSVTVTAVQKSTYQITFVDEEPEDSCFISVKPGEINVYDTTKPGCGSRVTIPSNLRLKTTTVESVTFNNAACMAFMDDQDDCDDVESEIENMTPSQIYDTMYAAFVTPVYGSMSENYIVIDTIGAGAFASKDITNITFSNNIEEIKDAAFAGNNLTNITFPNSLQSIGSYVFVGNNLGGVLTIPEGVTSIGYQAFIFCGSFSTVTIPSTVTTMGRQLFFGAEIASLNIDVVNISEESFENAQIQTLTLGNHVQTIGEDAFTGNRLTGTLTIPANVVSIGDSAFAGDKEYNQDSTLTTIEFLPNSNLTSIGNSAFAEHDNVATVITNMTEQQWNSIAGSSLFSSNPAIVWN